MTNGTLTRHRLLESLDLGFAVQGLDLRDFTDTDFLFRDLDLFPGWGTGTARHRYERGKKRGEFLPIYTTEEELFTIQARSRYICAVNEFASNVRKNCRNYAVGAKGLKHRATADSDDAEPLAKAVQQIIDACAEGNGLPTREQEMVVRLVTDGEFFLRLFEQPSGLLETRFVEPEHVKAPSGEGYDARHAFGVETPANDPGGPPSGYWIVENPLYDPTPAFVPAREVIHCKWDSNSNSKRGLPMLYAAEGLLKMAEELMVSMTSLAKNRAKLAAVRTLPSGTTQAAAQSLVDRLTSATFTDVRAARGYRSLEHIPYGSIATITGDGKIEFPAGNVDAASFVQVLQAILRAVAALVQFPEWMLTVDSSNANYSSSLIAEAPSTKGFEFLQDVIQQASGESRRQRNESLLWRQVAVAVRRGALPPAVFRAVKIQSEPPSLVVRDRGQEATVNKTYVELGVKSLQTVAQEQGLDFEQEQANRKVAPPPQSQGQGLGNSPPGFGQEQPPRLPGGPDTGIEGNPASEGGSGGTDPFGIDARFLESLQEAGFTGTIRDKRGREYHYVNGKRVARPRDAQPAARRHSVDEVHQHINSLLQGKEPVTPQQLREVGEMLLTMSVKDAHEVKKRLGLQASGRKEELAQKIAERAFASANVTPKNPVGTPANVVQVSLPDVPSSDTATQSPTSQPPRKPKGITVEWYGDEKAEAHATMKKLFGRVLKPEEIGAAACAPPGAKVSVGVTRYGGLVLYFDHEGVSAQRQIHDTIEGPRCYNEYFEITQDSRHKGTGANLFLDQVRQLKSLGVANIHTEASGNGLDIKEWEDEGKKGESPYNGYYTWPRLGYSGVIGEQGFEQLPPEWQEKLGDSRDIQTLYAMPGGREVWKYHGAGLKCTFDLSDGSKNLELLDNYIRERNAKT